MAGSLNSFFLMVFRCAISLISMLNPLCVISYHNEGMIDMMSIIFHLKQSHGRYRLVIVCQWQQIHWTRYQKPHFNVISEVQIIHLVRVNRQLMKPVSPPLQSIDIYIGIVGV